LTTQLTGTWITTSVGTIYGQLNLCSIDTPTDVYSVFFLQFRTFAQKHVTWSTSQFTIFRQAKATRCTRSELTQARRGRCHKRQQRHKVIKHRMYNYRKRGTNEPTVTRTIFGSTVGYPSDSLASCLDHLTQRRQHFLAQYRFPTD